MKTFIVKALVPILPGKKRKKNNVKVLEESQIIMLINIYIYTQIVYKCTQKHIHSALSF